MTTQFVDQILMRDERDTNFMVESMPERQALRLVITGDDGSATLLVPYELVPALAERMCQLVSRAGKVILGSDEHYPDY